jgi:hypothetical protein
MRASPTKPSTATGHSSNRLMFSVPRAEPRNSARRKTVHLADCWHRKRHRQGSATRRTRRRTFGPRDSRYRRISTAWNARLCSRR